MKKELIKIKEDMISHLKGFIAEYEEVISKEDIMSQNEEKVAYAAIKVRTIKAMFEVLTDKELTLFILDTYSDLKKRELAEALGYSSYVAMGKEVKIIKSKISDYVENYK